MNFGIIKKTYYYLIMCTITALTILSVVFSVSGTPIQKVRDITYNNTNSVYSTLEYDNPSTLRSTTANPLVTVNESVAEYIADKIQNLVNSNDSKTNLCGSFIGNHLFEIKEKFKDDVAKVYSRIYTFAYEMWDIDGLIRLTNGKIYAVRTNENYKILSCRELD
ncbi:MADS-box transcription factor 21 [Dictyocoela muelleri]|nr:MADS-box transcription factor 21 [Dictyocoela muelleri]